jgi:hypothetical protein
VPVNKKRYGTRYDLILESFKGSRKCLKNILEECKLKNFIRILKILSKNKANL